ncbi:SUMF1/EgtB/PvdO family nonheme iron enzyme [Lyngbya sp. CCY1209]|uniref:bifunctional serine/threonine-protein kinase/formylglycine-generating enzyme family protein n=1 Tax=Lyngbya sp. CCY1209 TaxID=2886103 RepID=UPI002D20148B|nr:SUMF1/EgtB/PvdO family nonheme iron enzyme [Lyngbya sp. CCY1209]MEB3884552.1 bifunctional serine/threonine-protein kinase/formylglycine-generating enzyme family protein [Lyngbya sp. CCY1209]
MIQCLNPDCLHGNPDGGQFCQKCGGKLRLAERYWARRILGQGGFGRTFLAVDDFKPSKPPCVIKQFLPQAQGTGNLDKAAELFDQEARRLEELGKHPQIPELLAYFTTDNRQYLVQEFIDGETLQQELENNGAFTEKQIRELLRDLLTVLKFVHDRNVIHRDIKPENIIRRESDNRLVLVDFGAAKAVPKIQRSVTGTIIGSAEYCAPEQAMGKPRFASDLYSLGVTCLHLLTQMSPFNLYDPVEGEWIWRDGLNGNAIGDELGQILDRLVATTPKKRYQSVSEVLGELKISSKRNFPLPPPPPRPGLKSFRGKTKLPPPPPPSSIKPKIHTFEFDVVKLNSTGREIGRDRGKAEFIIESLGNGVILEMVLIPGGSFTMGSPAHEEGRSNDESPQRQVTIQPFLIAKYPITQAQWQRVVNFPRIQRDLDPDLSRFQGSDRPAERVSWYDAVEFCARLSQKTRKLYRLPSEAEWEYAARAGTTTPFHLGETITTNFANYNGNSSYGYGPKGVHRKQTTPINFQHANAFGLFDIHGNVWEWCADPWHNSYLDAPSDGSVWDEKNNDNRYQNYVDNIANLLNDGRRRVERGGSWRYHVAGCRCASRGRGFPIDWHSVLGFRVACTLSGRL